MQRQKISFDAEPRGGVYNNLLDYSLGCCSTFLLVYRPFPDLSEGARNIRKKLLGFVVEETVVSAWPGTQMYRASPVLGRYCLEPESIEVLKQAARGLYDWGNAETDLPEDLCLLRPDGTPWLVTTGHEKAAYLRVTEQEKSTLVEAIPQLGDLFG